MTRQHTPASIAKPPYFHLGRDARDALDRAIEMEAAEIARLRSLPVAEAE